jgi:hypothetical protein
MHSPVCWAIVESQSQMSMISGGDAFNLRWAERCEHTRHVRSHCAKDNRQALILACKSPSQGHSFPHQLGRDLERQIAGGTCFLFVRSVLGRQAPPCRIREVNIE